MLTGQHHTSAALTLWKNSVTRRIGACVAQSRPVRSEEGKDHFPAPGLEIRTVQPVEVATPTALFQ